MGVMATSDHSIKEKTLLGVLTSLIVGLSIGGGREASELSKFSLSGIKG